ncbi:MAG TPA: hypothetical protein VIS06_11875 [Mycobacteriales bacterium]
MGDLYPPNPHGTGLTPEALDPLAAAESLRRDLDDAITCYVGTEASLDDWEQAVRRHGRASRDQPPSVLLTDLTSDLTDLRHALTRCRSTSAVRRLTRVVAQMSGLMCLTLIKLNEHAAFRRWARTARVAAVEVGDPVTLSWVRAHEAHGHYYAGQFTEAVRVARHAQDLASHNTCVGVVLAAALEARAHAALGRDEDTRMALHHAETGLSRLDPHSVVASACGYDEAQFRFHEENALTRLHDTTSALAAQERALDLYPASDYLDRTLVRLDRATCLAHDGDTKTAMSHATHTLANLTDEQRRGIITLRARDLVHSLPSAERALPAVRELGDLLVPTTRPQEG